MAMISRSAQTVIAELPKMAWSINPADPCLVITVKPGVLGYYPAYRCASAEAAREMAARMNTKDGVTPAQVVAMEYGSLFGWDAPIADPKNWESGAI